MKTYEVAIDYTLWGGPGSDEPSQPRHAEFEIQTDAVGLELEDEVFSHLRFDCLSDPAGEIEMIGCMITAKEG